MCDAPDADAALSLALPWRSGASERSHPYRRTRTARYKRVHQTWWLLIPGDWWQVVGTTSPNLLLRPAIRHLFFGHSGGQRGHPLQSGEVAKMITGNQGDADDPIFGDVANAIDRDCEI